MAEQLAIMKDVRVGLGDRDEPYLWFTMCLDESSRANWRLCWTDAGQLIKTAGVTDVKYLEGKPIWVERGDGVIHFKRYCKM